MTYDVGDYAVLTLDVPEGTVATSATVTAWTRPDGAPATLPNAVPTDADHQHWEAVAPLDVAGDWTAVWTVTGPGASVETYAVQVAPLPSHSRRAYATTTDLAEWLEGAPPARAGRALANATILVDDRLVSAVYDVTGPAEMPTDPNVAAAFRDAVCAQVEAWLETGTGINGPTGSAVWSQVTAGRITLVRAGGQAPPGPAAGKLAPAAVACLRRIPGLLGQPGAA